MKEIKVRQNWWHTTNCTKWNSSGGSLTLAENSWYYCSALRERISLLTKFIFRGGRGRLFSWNPPPPPPHPQYQLVTALFLCDNGARTLSLLKNHQQIGHYNNYRQYVSAHIQVRFIHTRSPRLLNIYPVNNDESKMNVILTEIREKLISDLIWWRPTMPDYYGHVAWGMI